ncbi:IPT/TIG domain-containing protein [Kitasatospora sp. NPDC058170]|uniref:IPT/TIG domain-containing protein n=1 Tax=Kitasatospora sp. NPDC058170 TaxID=3346364 RepID=UPI0036DB81E4
MASDPAIAQVTMTLAALAATANTTRPSGESLPQQTARIITGIDAQLSDPGLATQGAWELVWLALSEANANMAFIARSTDGSNAFAVVARGTDADITDILEDLEVGTVVPFPESGSPTPVAVSKGAKEAFTQVTTAVSIASPSPNATLAQALTAALKAAPSSPQPTVYVTGHSLGGCIASMLAPYLQAQTWPKQPQPQFAVMTFAAPTAGLQSFVDYVDSRPWLIDERQNNAYDLVPHAWADLVTTTEWYPGPGPQATDEVKLLIKGFAQRTKGNVYVQPGTLCLMNPGYTYLAKNLVNKTTQDFLAQVAFQHANATYLDLVGAPDVPAGPVVTDVSPTFGSAGDTVTINGTGFSPDSMVDFGTYACIDPVVDPSGIKITAKVPAGHGVVHVRVTNTLATSPPVAMGQFAYGGPAPVVVSAVSPTSGNVGTPVTVSGSGFAEGATVYFKDKASDSVRFVSTGEIIATAPGLIDVHQTVDITVKVGTATSPTSPADEFTYTGR